VTAERWLGANEHHRAESEFDDVATTHYLATGAVVRPGDDAVAPDVRAAVSGSASVRRGVPPGRGSAGETGRLNPGPPVVTRMRSLLSMRWADVLFAHWPVAPTVVAPTLPAGLDVDTYEGDAYLGIVGFRMASIRPRGVPLGRSFPELNLRTYVRSRDGPGVYFYNLDADDRLGVALARRLFELPYYRAEMHAEDRGTGVRLRSRRTHPDVASARFEATYRPTGPTEPATPGSLAAFLTERYRFYTESDGGRLYRGAIEHPPWELSDATLSVRSNTLFEANGFDRPAGDPLVHYSPGSDVTAGRIRAV
jgi:uncharacterized protein YqjF (DUF2071 family)